jgi:hypothetical protein
VWLLKRYLPHYGASDIEPEVAAELNWGQDAVPADTDTAGGWPVTFGIAREP